jgi:hypothetical protein
MCWWITATSNLLLFLEGKKIRGFSEVFHLGLSSVLHREERANRILETKLIALLRIVELSRSETGWYDRW